ncbi:MAG: hypothetical protein IT372_16315 [Polyangiaceae bacterium]|nr:hypothetical protein [Polyangiaceae bacterium]
MSASESDAKKPGEGEPDEPAPLVEDDAHETRMTYDPSSRVPKIVMAVWATLLVSYVLYMSKYFVPDLMKWGRP